MDLSKWGKEDKAENLPKPVPPGVSDEDLKKMSDFQIRLYGELTQDILEAMLVGYLVEDKDVANKIDTRENVDVLVNSGLKGDCFENEAYGILFNDLITYVRTHRTPMSLDEAEQQCIVHGHTHDQAMMYRLALARCHAVMITRRMNIRILVNRMKNHYRLKKSDQIISLFIKDRTDPEVGPEKALDKFKYSVAKDLTDLNSSVLKEYDWMEDCESDIAWLLDMKQNPEKYMGYMCGMNFVDSKTGGFRPGQLTVLVGRHGGYKSTAMMNIAYGLWKNGYNVLYASLEMEAKLVKAKLWCRCIEGFQWTSVYKGLISQPGDWDKHKQMEYTLSQMPNGPEKDAFRKKRDRLYECITELRSNGERILKDSGKSDVDKIREFKEQNDASANRLKIINVGQSEKIKPSQIEKRIEEEMEVFKPHVVVVDYLALVASDTPYPDRRDLEIGEVCKRFRNMGDRLGFSVITAAQYKMTAIARIRKNGFNQPDKAQFNTDDIAESNQIGADADNVIMLWPKEGGTELIATFPKCRHGGADTVGKVIQIVPERCMIGEDIGNTQEIRDGMTVARGLDLLSQAPLAPEAHLEEFGADDSKPNDKPVITSDLGF